MRSWFLYRCPYFYIFCLNLVSPREQPEERACVKTVSLKNWSQEKGERREKKERRESQSKQTFI